MFEDTKRVIRIRILKNDRPCNDQKKKKKKGEQLSTKCTHHYN
jgi:hypothetical protein